MLRAGVISAGVLTIGLLIFIMLAGAPPRAASLVYPTAEKLGEALFFDTSLSRNRTQACATCHSPDFGFADQRETTAGKAVSMGDDDVSLGDRNAPSAAYAYFTPELTKLADGNWAGGLFWDGRAKTLADQAGGPPLNHIEMGMPDSAAVEARLIENPDYAAALTALYGADVLTKPGEAYRAMTEALAAFEKTATFAPFDSRYDRYLKDEVKFTEQEELGRTLFFSTQFASCSLCHDVKARSGALEGAMFSGYKYFNIGVPANAAARSLNGVHQPDIGLAGNPSVKGDPKQAGKFKTPSLRNVAVTGPYMHNGVFAHLRTVVLFYNKYNSKKASRQINPETAKPWDEPEIGANLARTELETGPGLDDRRVDALVAFLKTLTDKRYEGLIGK